MTKKTLLLIAVIILTGAEILSAKDGIDTVMTKERQVKVLKLMNLIQMDVIGENMYENFILSYKGALPSAPATYWDTLKTSIGFKDLNEQLSKVYIKYFTDKEIAEMSQFFASPVGKKFVDMMQNVSMDVYEIAERWFKPETDKIKDRLIQDGYLNIQN